MEMHEKIFPDFALEIALGCRRISRMPFTREDQQIEALAGIDQAPHQPKAVRDVNIFIHIAVDQQELASQLPGEIRVGRIRSRIASEIKLR